MKNSWIILIILAVWACEKPVETLPITTVTTKVTEQNPVKITIPKINFSYKILDSGKVQLNYLGPDSNIVTWASGNIRSSRQKNPIFIFQENEVQNIYLSVQNKSTYADTAFLVPIKNAINDSWKNKMEGVLFDYKIDSLDRSMFNINGSSLAYLPSIPFYQLELSGVLQGLIADKNVNPSKDYQALKSSLAVGKKKLARFRIDYSNNTVKYDFISDGWAVRMLGVKNSSEYNFGDSETDILEVIQLEEVPQLKLSPETNDKALIVTYRIKADTKNGKIDLKLKLRYQCYVK